MTMAYSNCLLFLFLIMFLTINISALQPKNLTLSEVALFVVRDHLSNLTSTIVLAEKGITPDSTTNNTLLLEYILQNLNGRIAIQFYISNYSEQPFEYYVFIVDSLEAFRELHNDFKDSLFERHFRFIIVLTQQTKNLRSVMEQIFVLCHSFDVIDVNIIARHQIFGVAMFTYYLYSETVCRRCVPILLYNCNQEIENLKMVFPEKLTNLHGCPLRVSGRSFAPFVSFKGNRNDPKPVGAWENLSGIEGSLLKFLAKSLNFTIDLQPVPSEASFYNINHTSGCFSQLLKKKADIIIGGFIDSSFGRMIFSPTNTYHSSHFKYVIQGKIDVNSLDRLTKPFNSVLWWAVASFFCLNIITMSYLRTKSANIQEFVFGEENRSPVTNFLAIFLGYSIRRTPRRNFARYIFSHLLFLTLVLRSAYQGSLYDAFFMDRFTRIPLGYEDLVKWNYTFFLPPEGVDSIYFPPERTIKIMHEEYQKRFKTLDRLDGKYVTASYQDCYIDYFKNNLQNHTTKLILLPEIIYNYQFVLYLPKHSIFLPVLNIKIFELAAAGILKKITNNLRMNDKVFKTYFKTKSDKIPLRNKRLEALYVICGCMIGISVVVFCFEILSVNKCKWLQWIFA